MRTAILMLMLMLTGCAALTPQQTAPVQDLAAGLEDGGCVNLLLGAKIKGKDRTGFIIHSLLYRRVGAVEGGRFVYERSGIGDTPRDIDTDVLGGSALRVCLKPGEYEAFAVSYYWNNGQTEKTVSNEAPFSLPFSVAVGEEIYLGRVVAHGVWGKNFLGMPLPAGAVLVVENAISEDAGIIKTRYPEAGEIQVRLLATDGRSAPYVMPSALYGDDSN